MVAELPEGSRRGKGHNLVSQGVALRRSFALRWVAARFRFVIKHARERNARGKTQGHPMCHWDRASVRRAPLDGRLAGIVPGEAEVEEPADSLTSGMRESRG
jgi:hypothetical protein